MQYSVCSPVLVSHDRPTVLRFASYYADHMVLQKGPERAAVWGYANAEAVNRLIKVQVLSGSDRSLQCTRRAVIEQGKLSLIVS